MIFTILALPAFGEEAAQKPGILPGHPLYLFKLAVEKIQIALAHGPEAKIDTYIHLAESKLAEAETLFAKGQPSNAQKALQLYDKYLKRTEDVVEQATDQGKELRDSLVDYEAASRHNSSVLERLLINAPVAARAGLQNALTRSRQGLDSIKPDAVAKPGQGKPVAQPAIPVQNKASQPTTNHPNSETSNAKGSGPFKVNDPELRAVGQSGPESAAAKE